MEERWGGLIGKDPRAGTRTRDARSAGMLHVELMLLINIIAYSICCTEFMEIYNRKFEF